MAPQILEYYDMYKICHATRIADSQEYKKKNNTSHTYETEMEISPFFGSLSLSVAGHLYTLHISAITHVQYLEYTNFQVCTIQMLNCTHTLQ